MSGGPVAPALQVNGWTVFAHPLFLAQLETLTSQVEALRRKDPTGYLKKNATKRLAAIRQLAFEVIPQDPTRPEYCQGNTLGDQHRHWFRAKFGNGRFRLFFRYSTAAKIIIFAWVNDSNTLRTYGSKSDAYAVFKSMLDKGNPPEDWEALLEACPELAAG